MSHDDDPHDPKALRIDPATFATPHVPTKIRKRKKDFAMVPMSWYEILKEPLPTGLTVMVALHLCYLCWKNGGKPFKLPNGMLEYDGISRQTKWRALAVLERRGLITIERRPKKSPIIRLLLTGGLFRW
jgi:hypothetical protein